MPHASQGGSPASTTSQGAPFESPDGQDSPLYRRKGEPASGPALQPLAGSASSVPTASAGTGDLTGGTPSPLSGRPVTGTQPSEDDQQQICIVGRSTPDHPMCSTQGGQPSNGSSSSSDGDEINFLLNLAERLLADPVGTLEDLPVGEVVAVVDTVADELPAPTGAPAPVAATASAAPAVEPVAQVAQVA